MFFLEHYSKCFRFLFTKNFTGCVLVQLPQRSEAVRPADVQPVPPDRPDRVPTRTVALSAVLPGAAGQRAEVPEVPDGRRRLPPPH